MIAKRTEEGYSFNKDNFMNGSTMPFRPKLAIIDPNALEAIGLRNILQEVMPIVVIDHYLSLEELTSNQLEQYFHFFAPANVVLQNHQFFQENRKKTIVLVSSKSAIISNLHCLHINVPEKELVRSLLTMFQSAHPHGKNLPDNSEMTKEKALSKRELEVLCLIVKGLINKEIADKLHIGLSTVITHRRNIMDKLEMKSVSALTIYAVMHGLVDIDKI